MIEVISTEKFKNEIFDFSKNESWVYEKSKPVILNFTAQWCGPCRMYAPILEQISEEYGGSLDVFKIDIDASPEVPALFGIRSVPTTLFIAPNEEPALAIGIIQKEDLQRAIEEILKIPSQQ